MTASSATVKIGTRSSPLAIRQGEHLVSLLIAARPGLECVIRRISTEGDRMIDRPLPEIGGKGLFTAELETRLRDGAIDLAVHSLKDLPVEDAPGLTLGAIAGRADIRDALISRDGRNLASLKEGAVVGTGSLRRQAQLLAARPDLQIRSIRGNVGTRIQKVMDGQYDATVLALAGLSRLGLDVEPEQILPPAVMLPAPGQGALAVQCRADDEQTLRLLAMIDDAPVRACVSAEREFLNVLGGGCALPVAALARSWPEKIIHLSGLIASTDGRRVIRVQGQASDPLSLGAMLAREAIEQGAQELLAHVP